jgi:hypothetical protein
MSNAFSSSFLNNIIFYNLYLLYSLYINKHISNASLLSLSLLRLMASDSPFFGILELLSNYA